MKTELAHKFDRLLGETLPEDITRAQLQHKLVEAGYPQLTRMGITPAQIEAFIDAELAKKEAD